MITYLYESIPAQPGEKPRYFELKQSIQDPAYTQHPETGEAIRRVVLGGIGFLTKQESAGSGTCGCGPSGCC